MTAAGDDLFKRCAAAVRAMPAKRAPFFSVACAERFFEGFVEWSKSERVRLPGAPLIRQAIDRCWSDQVDPGVLDSLLTQIKSQTPNSGQVRFSDHLSIYVVELSLVAQALAARLVPSTEQALLCSEYGLDFHLQLADLRRELAGVGPDDDHPDRDVREFEADVGAWEEAERQIADAEILGAGPVDLSALRLVSVAHGRRVLDRVLQVVRGTDG